MADLKTDEPVLVGTAALAAVNAALGVLVTHHIITDTQASSWTQTLVPIVAAALTILAGVVIRRFTTPWRKVAGALEQSGLITDADLARFGQLVRDELDARLVHAETPEPAAPVAATDADLAPHVDVPDGMSAGAPTPAATGA